MYIMLRLSLHVEIVLQWIAITSPRSVPGSPKTKKDKKINYNDIFDEYLAFVVVLFVDRHLDFWVEFKIRGRSLCPFIACLRIQQCLKQSHNEKATMQKLHLREVDQSLFCAISSPARPHPI